MDQAAAKTPEAENPLNLSNGVLKRNHHAAFNYHQAAAGAGDNVVYKECLKNHAASLGAHAVDGCGDFMASPTANPADPTSLKCAACGCHRNFHRREPEDVSFPSSNTTPALEYRAHHRHHPPPPPPRPLHGDAGAHSSPSSPSPPPISSSYYPSAPHLLLTLSGGMSSAATTPQAPASSKPSGRKRFRTRFTQQQKEKMTEFAENLGWKMQKRDEELIFGFCNEIGVEKGVFKVWMHNNKSNFGRRDQPVSIPSTGVTTTAVNNDNGVAFGQNYHENENEGNNNNDHFQEQNVNRHSDSFSGRAGGPNGSSSSS